MLSRPRSSVFGTRPIGQEVPVPKTARQCAAIRDQLMAAVRAKADAMLHLMQALVVALFPQLINMRWQ